MALSKGKKYKGGFCKNTIKNRTPAFPSNQTLIMTAVLGKMRFREGKTKKEETSLLSTHVIPPFRSAKKLEKKSPIKKQSQE